MLAGLSDLGAISTDSTQFLNHLYPLVTFEYDTMQCPYEHIKFVKQSCLKPLSNVRNSMFNS